MYSRRLVPTSGSAHTRPQSDVMTQVYPAAFGTLALDVDLSRSSVSLEGRAARACTPCGHQDSTAFTARTTASTAGCSSAADRS